MEPATFGSASGGPRRSTFSRRAARALRPAPEGGSPYCEGQHSHRRRWRKARPAAAASQVRACHRAREAAWIASTGPIRSWGLRTSIYAGRHRPRCRRLEAGATERLALAIARPRSRDGYRVVATACVRPRGSWPTCRVGSICSGRSSHREALPNATQCRLSRHATVLRRVHGTIDTEGWPWSWRGRIRPLDGVTYTAVERRHAKCVRFR